MKHQLIVLAACLSAVLFSSCEQSKTYTSGKYFYYYYLVNKTSSPVEVTCGKQDWLLLVNDTANIAYDEKVNEISNEQPYEVAVEQLVRPSIEDGYQGTIDQGNFTLTYQNKVYVIDDAQANSFLRCANYKGIQSPKSDFIYDYYFVIDEDYIATLPLKN